MLKIHYGILAAAMALFMGVLTSRTAEAGAGCGCGQYSDATYTPGVDSTKTCGTPAAAPAGAGYDKMPAVGTKAKCPVSGNEFEVTKDTTFSVYKGKYYVFCCPGCKPQFDKNPGKFLK